MSLPGFTAEASIGPTTQVYRVQDRYGTAAAFGLYPQWNGGDMGAGGEEILDDEAAMEMADDEAMEMAEDDVEADGDLEGSTDI